MSFRGRIVGAVLALTTVSLGGAFFAVFLVEDAAQLQRLDEAIRSVADEELVAIGGQSSGTPVLRSGNKLRTVDGAALPKYAALYDGEGRLLDASSSFVPVPPLSALPARRDGAFNFWSGRDHLRGAVFPAGRDRMSLLVATSRAEVDEDRGILARSMALVFLAALAWAALVANWIVVRFTRHHQAIAQVARRVAAGDLTARVKTRSPDPEVAQLARDIDEMIDRLAMLVSSQQRFIAHAAHELRSPLTTLYGELSHALRKERDAQSYRQTIDEALDSTRKLKALTEDLLTLARTASPGEDPSERTAVVDVLKAAAGSVEGEASSRGVEVSIVESDAMISGRQRDLERMVRNVIENAVRHSPEGGKVEVRTSRSQEGVEIVVHDDGPGVSSDERERIFEPFFRGAGERARDLPGAGLGLAIAREIARAHGGDVALLATDEAPGTGFRIRLPLSG